MAKEEVAAEAADRAHQKTGLRAKGHAGDHNNGRHRLKVVDHLKRRPGRDGNGTQDRQHHQFPRLGFATLENQEKGNHGIQNDQHTGQIVHPSPGAVAQVNGGRNHNK